MDDEARFRGDIALCSEGLYRNEKCSGTVTVGQAGKLAQVMGMAKVPLFSCTLSERVRLTVFRLNTYRLLTKLYWAIGRTRDR